MKKRIKSILFVICAVMVFTAQTNRSDEKGQQREVPQQVVHRAPPTAPQPRTSQPSYQQREVPQQVVHRAPPTTVQTRISSQPSYQRREAPEQREAPRVYGVPASAPVGNNRLFNRRHHNHWQPLYNFYNNQYQFYPYVNITSSVELSADCAAVLLNGQTYYYDQGSFYVQEDGGYLAVPPPVGIIVSAIPQNARQINVNGQIYYRYKGVFYIQVAQGYQVVGPLQVPVDGP